MKRLRILLQGLVFLSVVMGVGYLWYQHKATTAPSRDAKVIKITINPGTNFDQASKQLASSGVIDYAWLFNLRARQRNKRQPIKAGMYRFRSNMSPDQVMDRLGKAPDVLLQDLPLKFRLNPGENIFQAAAKMRSLEVAGDFMAIAKDAILVQNLGAPLPDHISPAAYTALEGYFYPDTYYLNRKRPRAKDAVRRAVRKFNEVWNEVRLKNAASYAEIRSRYGLSDHQLITLASLVEKEIGVNDEAPKVAAVFYNRIKLGLKLQTDPTMVYAPGTWNQAPSPRHRRNKGNLYNTYQIKGLPPGPIANPGLASLQAVVAPATTNKLYFVARRDGSGRHAFAVTLDEHRANIHRYLKKKR